MASGRDVIGASWKRIYNENAPENHATLVAPDGTLGTDIALSPRHLAGTGGTATVLWHATQTALECHFEREAFDATLQRTTDVVHVEFAPHTIARTITFDGARYVAFWITPEQTAHLRTLDENGVLGSVIDLGMSTNPIMAASSPQCVSAASDRDGVVFLWMNEEAFFVDVATGAKQLVWQSFPYPEYPQTLFFAGEFHVADYRWFTIDRSGASRERIGDMNGTNAFYPGTTSLYARAIDHIVEVDRDLRTVARHPFTFHFGAYENDPVYFEEAGGGIVLSRVGHWQRDIAFDSPVETVDCN